MTSMGTRAPHISPETIALLRAAGYVVLDPDIPAVLNVIRQAVTEPGRFTPREPVFPSGLDESLERWRSRAVLAGLAALSRPKAAVS